LDGKENNREPVDAVVVVGVVAVVGYYKWTLERWVGCFSC